MTIEGKITMVPPWLRGRWKRSYIRRVDTSTGFLDEPDSTVEVSYIQTPWAFVDIRRPAVSIDGSKEVAMAFAGVTSVLEDKRISNTPPPLVNWHACLEMDSAAMDCSQRWSEAEAGNPRPTDDKGFFQDVSEEVGIPHAYLESDPDKTLEELWIRTDDGDGRFLACRNDNALLVSAGDHFGFVDQDNNIFVAGRIAKDKGLVIEISAADKSLEGTILNLQTSGLKLLPGSSLDINDILNN